jgi:hypothetical protein
MTVISNTPANKNFLSPFNFKFILKRAPYVNFFIQSINLPGISLEPVEIQTPLIAYPVPGEHLSYEELTITFQVDENLQNYLEIHNWIRALGKLNYSEYGRIASNKKYTGESLYSDIVLEILASTRQPNYEAVFVDAHPIGLSSLKFNTTDADIQFIEADAIFRYTNYEIKKSS